MSMAGHCAVRSSKRISKPLVKVTWTIIVGEVAVVVDIVAAAGVTVITEVVDSDKMLPRFRTSDSELHQLRRKAHTYMSVRCTIGSLLSEKNREPNGMMKFPLLVGTTS